MSANLMSLASSGGKFLKLFGDRKMVKTMPTARDYVQDGLIAMLDGIENAGWGVHDLNATVWKDLIGSYDFNLSDGAFFTGLGARRDSLSQLGLASRLKDSKFYNQVGAIELCASITNQSNTSSCGIWLNSILGDKSKGLIIGSIVQYNNVFWRTGLTVPYSATMYGSKTKGCVNGVALETFGNDTWKASGNRYYIFSRGTIGFQAAGTAHCVRFYNRDLSPEEVAANYAIDKARFNLTTPTI